MLDSFLTLLKSEWPHLSAAPWAFAFFSVSAFLLAFAACRWGYQVKLDTAKERVDALKERLAEKEAELGEYRKRLNLVPGNGNKLAPLTNKELREQTLKFVEEMRGWLGRTTREKTAQAMELHGSMSDKSKTEDENIRIWIEKSNSIGLEFQKMMEEFVSIFKTDAILLRDELVTRLPQSERRVRADARYENPVNTFSVEAIIDDLERRAKLLE